MHVVLFGPVPPPHGGVQTHVMALRDYLRSKGVRVSVVNLTRHRREDGDDIYYPDSAGAVLGLMARLRPDVFHLHFGGNLFRRDLALLVACGLFPGARSVLTFHSGGFPSSPAGRAVRKRSFLGFAFRRLDGLIGVNREIVEVFHRAGVPEERTEVIEPHHLAETGPVADAVLPEPVERFFETHRPVLMAAVLLEPEYEVFAQIDAFEGIREHHPDAGLLIVGSGSLEEPIRRHVAASSAGEHILVAGDVPHAATLQAMRRAAVLIRATRYDGDSLSVREALHLGTPVLASDTAMRPPGVHLLPEISPAAIRDGALRVLELPAESRRAAPQGSGNMERVMRMYTARANGSTTPTGVD